MADGQEIRFRIDAYSPQTMPMARLAEYMADMAKILGEASAVHFVRLDPGSTVLVQRVDAEAISRVRARARAVQVGSGPEEALQSFRRIDRRLYEDDADGTLVDESGAEIMRFPGRNRVEELAFGPLHQDGSLDGRVIRLGGRGDPVPVHIQSADRLYTHCLASRELAKELGCQIFGPELRVSGTGKWSRDAGGDWNLDRFIITSFIVLDEAPLGSVVAGLREIQGNEWGDLDEPWLGLKQERDEQEDTH